MISGSRRVATAFHAYDMAWRILVPFLRRNTRMGEGFGERSLHSRPPAEADLWIQVASVGEAYLAGEIVARLCAGERHAMLLTANTSQGVSILRQAAGRAAASCPDARLECRHFPFDRPTLMRRMLQAVRPRLIVLLETEIWPGLLAAARDRGVPVMIVNGRMTGRSLRRYRLWPEVWRSLRPSRVLAVSRPDAARFARLFGPDIVGRMPNIKFDRLEPSADAPAPAREIGRILPAGCPLVVFGSVRRQEEPVARRMLGALLAREPGAVVGLFPRHLHRVERWCRTLDRMRVRWVRRSGQSGPVGPGTVILWDVVGELAAAYYLARAAFVGGSLAPLGGQNFLEALVNGVRPVIGPHWENFAWVGPEVQSRGLVRVAADWKQAADLLIADVLGPPPGIEARKRVADFIRSRRGGAAQACVHIRSLLAVQAGPPGRAGAGGGKGSHATHPAHL